MRAYDERGGKLYDSHAEVIGGVCTREEFINHYARNVFLESRFIQERLEWAQRCVDGGMTVSQMQAGIRQKWELLNLKIGEAIGAYYSPWYNFPDGFCSHGDHILFTLGEDEVPFGFVEIEEFVQKNKGDRGYTPVLIIRGAQGSKDPESPRGRSSDRTHAIRRITGMHPLETMVYHTIQASREMISTGWVVGLERPIGTTTDGVRVKGVRDRFFQRSARELALYPDPRNPVQHRRQLHQLGHTKKRVMRALGLAA